MKKLIFIFGLSMVLGACSGTTSQSANTKTVVSSDQKKDTMVATDNTNTQGTSTVEVKKGGYQEMDQEEAKKLLAENKELILLDARTPDEYAGGHIPNALNLPNEDITDVEPEILPDKDQLILIYCRSGNRSGQAAQKLIDMGYTNVYNIGGINSWTGEVVK